MQIVLHARDVLFPEFTLQKEAFIRQQQQHQQLSDDAWGFSTSKSFLLFSSNIPQNQSYNSLSFYLIFTIFHNIGQ